MFFCVSTFAFALHCRLMSKHHALWKPNTDGDDDDDDDDDDDE